MRLEWQYGQRNGVTFATMYLDELIVMAISESNVHPSRQGLIVWRIRGWAPPHGRDTASQLAPAFPRDNHRFRAGGLPGRAVRQFSFREFYSLRRSHRPHD